MLTRAGLSLDLEVCIKFGGRTDIPRSIDTGSFPDVSNKTVLGAEKVWV